VAPEVSFFCSKVSDLPRWIAPKRVTLPYATTHQCLGGLWCVEGLTGMPISRQECFERSWAAHKVLHRREVRAAKPPPPPPSQPTSMSGFPNPSEVSDTAQGCNFASFSKVL
jgi:hypothetical protein